MSKHACAVILFLIAGVLVTNGQTNEATAKSPAAKMRALRLKALATTPKELGLTPTAAFPKVIGVVMDWPIDAGTVTTVSFSTGDASIYTTGTFGVIGGFAHETVRTAAKTWVGIAQTHYADATPTKDFPYPTAGRVRFYLVGYDEVRVIDTDLESVREGQDKCSDLYSAGQNVISELRLVTEEKKK